MDKKNLITSKILNKNYHLVILQFGISSKSELSNYIRPLGADKISWAAQNAGFNAISITRLQLLSVDEQKRIIEKYVTEKTVIGISTSLMSGVYYKSVTGKVLETFAETVNSISKKYNNKIVLGGQSANEYVPYFNNSISLENFDGENDIVDFLIKEFNFGIHKKPQSNWTIQNDNFQFPVNSFIQKQEMLPLEMSRGCIFSCKFCSFSRIGKEKGSYERNMNHIKDYILQNYNNYGTQYYFLTSDTVNDNNDRMNEWCDMLESLPFKIYYSGFFRIDLMNKYIDTSKRLFNTGLRGVNFGIETFHSEAGKIIEKPFTGQRAKDFMLKLYYDIFESKVCISVGMIVGLPKEPENSVYENAEWFKNEGKVIEASFNPLTLIDPTRGLQSPHYISKFSKNADKHGIVWSNKDKPLHWKHEHMDYVRACAIARKINKEIKTGVNHFGPWDTVQKLACNNDYSFIVNYFNQISGLS
jgi:hypothetical protein